ncbi:hypothetical protein DASC09_038380 [Saccharomycopsis crataegensis]|uniref:Uncharacterized protein n=1 Tax=Saccharomycopsis crataegensis TaxID=43959 RepID=A0AAV5QNQ9_9ASCO|nr:hypothetical protein DASC09_038380 [Saccharomycopsis crataegensis]
MLPTSILTAFAFCSAFVSAAPIDWATVNYNVNWATVQYNLPATTKAAVAAAATTHAAVATVAAQQKNVAATTSKSSNTASSSSSSSGSSSDSTSSFGSNSAVAFSQYKDSGGCKSKSELEASIRAMSSYSVIRLYDTDCDIVSIAMATKASNQKILVGIFYPDKWSDGVNTIKSAVSARGTWGDIFAITVGNEDVNDGTYTASQMAGYVSSVKSAISNKVPVAAVDVYSTIWNNKDLCNGDFVAANAHPYFDDSTSAGDCGTWLQTQITKLKSVCPGKNILITETGWPTAGDSGRASSSSQSSCLNSIKSSSIKDQVTLFSMWNEKWKSSGVEPYWGMNGNDPNAS